MLRDKRTGERVYERGDGIRRHYRESLEADRFRYPRRGLLHHPRSWYLSDAPLKRPAFGVYAMAAFGEDMLWRSMHAKKGMRPPYEAAARYFAATRRALQNVLSTYKIGYRLTAADSRRLRSTALELVEGARELVKTMRRVGENFSEIGT